MSDSDVEVKKTAPSKPGKGSSRSPPSDIFKPEKKVTTKVMIYDALTALKTRKGVSIQAMKKYMEDKYNIESEKVKYLIKKTLKNGIEDGTIIQLTGIGASGSFKLATVKEKPIKKPKPKKMETKKEKSTKEKLKEKPMKNKTQKLVNEKLKTDKTNPKKKVKMDVKDKEKVKKTENTKEKKIKEKGKTKMAATPKKKAHMMKRKSIGSIIKPPKMNPKSKA